MYSIRLLLYTISSCLFVSCSRLTDHLLECSSNQFHCHDNMKCVPNAWVCDEDKDCYDGSDELMCKEFKEPHHLHMNATSESTNQTAAMDPKFPHHSITSSENETSGTSTTSTSPCRLRSLDENRADYWLVLLIIISGSSMSILLLIIYRLYLRYAIFALNQVIVLLTLISFHLQEKHNVIEFR